MDALGWIVIVNLIVSLVFHLMSDRRMDIMSKRIDCAHDRIDIASKRLDNKR